MKFENEMKQIAFQLETKYKMCVLQCVYNEDDKELSTAEIEFLNKSHFKKIEISDAVYIVNINEYIAQASDIYLLDDVISRFSQNDEKIPYGPLRIKNLLAFTVKEL